MSQQRQLVLKLNCVSLFLFPCWFCWRCRSFRGYPLVGCCFFLSVFLCISEKKAVLTRCTDVCCLWKGCRLSGSSKKWTMDCSVLFSLSLLHLLFYFIRFFGELFHYFFFFVVFICWCCWILTSIWPNGDPDMDKQGLCLDVEWSWLAISKTNLKGACQDPKWVARDTCVYVCAEKSTIFENQQW